MSIKNPQTVKGRLDEADNMLQILQDSVRRGLAIDPDEAQRRFAEIRRRIKFALDNIQD